MKTKIEEVFNLNDEHMVFEFCKDYALNNPEFAEILIERFLPKKSIRIEDRFVEIDKEIDQCFRHIYRRDNYKELARRLNMLKNSCAVGKTYSAKLVDMFRANYRNRPAMLDELKEL